MNHSTTFRSHQALGAKSLRVEGNPIGSARVDDEQYKACKGREVTLLVNHSTTFRSNQTLGAKYLRVEGNPIGSTGVGDEQYKVCKEREVSLIYNSRR
ncbi:hypothetical protein ATZ33_17560 [Enterococcus silesiacus]|uniref:Uncharacterized protein n=1 Tax=Enterococcus silesiacus TaxID=332949 RepID=A0ABM5WDN1_9ENTE|nr:hypothetical protein ATZ33_17560 [Enterococcus silesiacus]